VGYIVDYYCLILFNENPYGFHYLLKSKIEDCIRSSM